MGAGQARDCNAEAFVSKLLSAAEPKLPEFNAQCLANTVWALAALRHHDDGFIGSVARQALLSKLEARAVSQSSSSLFPAWGTMIDAAFYNSIGSQLLSCQDLGLQEVCNAFHGLAMAGLHPPWASELLMDRLPALMLPIGSSKQMDTLLGQAFRYMLMLEARGLLSSGCLNSHAYHQMRERCCLAWIDAKGIPIMSRRHREVFEVVRQLPGCSGAVCEQQTVDGLFSMDIGVELLSSPVKNIVRLAIEVDGPSHFMSNRPDMATGETRLRNYLLEARGWRVVSLRVGTHAPWAKLVDFESREAFLKELIGKVVDVVEES